MIAALLVIDHIAPLAPHGVEVRGAVAVVAANYVQNHHERALSVMRQLR